MYCISLSSDLCTDIGLPRGQSRDGPFNTNNWAEAAFRVFDTVFLELLKNKRFCTFIFSIQSGLLQLPHLYRIDRLATIILDDFFPMYENWPHTETRPSNDFVNVTRRGHDLWASDQVHPHPTSKPNIFLVNYEECVPRSFLVRRSFANLHVHIS
jgi:hypothetical protein